jgi:hypothetical protein
VGVFVKSFALFQSHFRVTVLNKSNQTRAALAQHKQQARESTQAIDEVHQVGAITFAFVNHYLSCFCHSLLALPFATLGSITLPFCQ